MATAERRVAVQLPPSEALQACAKALHGGGFRGVAADENLMQVTAKKKTFSQWTASKITVSVTSASTGSEVLARSQASAQSLASAAMKPSEKLVQQFFEMLSTVVGNMSSAPSPVAESVPAGPTRDADRDSAEQVERLHGLLKAGALTQDEYEAEKAKVLGRSSS